MTEKRRVLITGASAGIGEACAREWARRGWNVVLAADLADPLAPVQLVEALATHGLTIDALINNAGYGLPGNYLSVPWRSHADFLRVLLWAPSELTYLLLPGMRERGYGRIVNVASLAGLVPPTAGHTLYGATKSYLIRFSQSLAQEVAGDGIHVTALCPGFTYSEFHDVNGMRGRVSELPRYMWMDAATVAREAFDAVEAGRMVHVNGRWNRFVAALAKYLPESLSLALTQRQAKKFRDSGHQH